MGAWGLNRDWKELKYLLASCRPEARYSTTTLQLSWLTWGWITLVTGSSKTLFVKFENEGVTSLCCNIRASSWVSFNLRTCQKKKQYIQMISVCDENKCVLVLKSLFHFSCCMKLYRKVTKRALVLLIRKPTSSSEWHLSQISPQRPTVSEISWQSASCDDDCWHYHYH